MNDELDWVPLLRGARGVFYVKQMIVRYQQLIYLEVTGNTIPFFFALIRKATTDSRFRGNDSKTNQIAIETSFLSPDSSLSQYSILTTQY